MLDLGGASDMFLGARGVLELDTLERNVDIVRDGLCSVYGVRLYQLDGLLPAYVLRMS